MDILEEWERRAENDWFEELSEEEQNNELNAMEAYYKQIGTIN